MRRSIARYRVSAYLGVYLTVFFTCTKRQAMRLCRRLNRTGFRARVRKLATKGRKP